MKAVILIFVLSLISFQNIMIAQNIKADSVFWNDGKVSLLSGLGSVWIIVKQGTDKKEVRLIEIKKEKGILVYEKEKCLHDIPIHNIKVIQPGKHPLSYMYFYSDNTPYIKKEWLRLDPVIAYSDFKWINGVVIRPAEPAVQKSEVKTTGSLCDTIIEENGNLTPVKIVEVDSKFIHYKKSLDRDSPIYMRCTNNADVKRYNTYIIINFTMK